MKKIINILLTIFIVCITAFFVVSCSGDSCSGSSSLSYTYDFEFVEQTVNIDRYSAPVGLKVKAKQSGVEIANPLVNFSCEASDVITISNDGLVTPKNNGSAIVKATWNGREASCTVVVYESGAIPSLKSNVENIGFVLGGESFKVLPYVQYLDEFDFGSDAKFLFSIPMDGQTVAVVDESGNVTPVGYGETRLDITAEFRGYKGIGMSISIPVRVNHDIEVHATSNVENIDVYAKSFSYEGKEYNNTISFSGNVSVLNENNVMSNIPEAQLTWNVSDQTVAEINDQGVLIAKKGGTCFVWCSYLYEGFEYASEQIEVDVNEYLMIDKTDELIIVLDESKNYLAPSKNIFGNNFSGEISGIYLNNEITNLLIDGHVNIETSVSGETTLTIANDIGYAYKVTAYIVAKEIIHNDTSFYIIKNPYKNTQVEYSFLLPELSKIENLLNAGYNKINIDYSFIDGLKTETILRSDFISELYTNVKPSTPGSFEICLYDLESRYNDFIGGYVFKILSDTDAKINFTNCTIIKDQNGKNIDARFERGFNVSKNNVGLDTIRETNIDNIKAQVLVEFTGDNECLPVSFSSSKLLSKNQLARMINLGYDTIRVNYILKHDAESLSTPIVATTTYGTQINLVANKQSYFDLDLRAIFAKHMTLVSSRNNSLFDINAISDNNGNEVNYQFALLDSQFVDNNNSVLSNVGVYSVNGMYYWTADGDVMNVKIDYNKEIAGKVAQISGSIDIKDLPRNGVGISCFYTLGITKDEVLSLINEGYTSLIFNYYLGTDYEGDDQIWLQTNDYFVDYKAVYNKWDKFSLSLEYIYNNYETLNGASGFDFLIKLTPVDGISVYNFAIGNVEVTNEILLSRTSNFYEYCANGPDNGFGLWEDGVLVDGRIALTTYTKETVNTEYGETIFTANWRYNINENQVANKIAEGKKYLAMDLYIGVKDTVIKTDTIDMAILVDDSTRKPVATNQWFTVYLPLNEFKSILSEGYTIRLWPIVDGAGGRNGTYSISYGGAEFIEEIPIPALALNDISRVEERCTNGHAPNVGNWNESTNVVVDGKTAIYHFYNTTRDMGYGDTTMYAYFDYTLNQDNIERLIALGNKYVKFNVRFGVSDTIKDILTINVSLTDNDSSLKLYETNKWIDVYVPLNDFKVIVGNGGYTFKLFPETDGAETTCGTYSISISDMSIVESLPINYPKLDNSSRVYEYCENAQAPNQGDWETVTGEVVSNVDTIKTFYNVTRSMGWGNSIMTAYWYYGVNGDDIQNLIDEGKEQLAIKVYFGVSDSEVPVNSLSVAIFGDNESKEDYETNTWHTVYISLQDFKSVIANEDYTFRIFVPGDGSEKTCGRYSISVAAIEVI